MQSSFKKAFSIALLLMIGGAFFPAPAQAITPAVCVYDQPRQVTSKTIETYSQWLKRQKLQLTNNACFADMKAVSKIYDSLAKKVTLDIQSKDKNEFNKRYDSCTKGTGSALNPATWLTSLKCLFTVSFFPTSDVLKVKFTEVLADFKSHQPTSYIPISLGVINNLRENWGGVSCSTGSITAQVNVPSMSAPWKFVIPCKPPTALQVFRNLMVLSIWIGFAFWLYRTGVTFWKERSA